MGGTARQLLVAHKSSGTLSFFPSSAAGTRRVVTEDGRPRANLTVARFVARPTRPAAPRQLRARRKGTTLKLSWAPAAHAERYVARIQLSDGRSLQFFVSTRDRSFTVHDVAPRTTASVRVVGALGRSVQGPAASVRVSARRPG